MHRETHEGLVESHRLLMVAFSSSTSGTKKRPITVDSDELPVAASASLLSSKFSLPTANLSPLVQTDYPRVKFWNKLEWKNFENARKDSTGIEAKSTGRGGTRSAKGENVMMLYIEDANGLPVNGAIAGAIREFARSIWRGFYSLGVAPEKWGDAMQEVRDKYCNEMENSFEVLRYCANHWKAHAVATVIYSQWYHTFDKKQRSVKTEPSPSSCDKLARKRSKTAGSVDSDGDNSQFADVTSISTPKSRRLEDPL